jgi:hypothetical protein
MEAKNGGALGLMRRQGGARRSSRETGGIGVAFSRGGGALL